MVPSLSSRRYMISLVMGLLPATRMFSFKRRIMKWGRIRVGKDTLINSNVRVYGPGSVEFGSGTWVGIDGYYAVPDPAVIRIGANCDIGPGVRFVCGSHEIGDAGRRAGRGVAYSINVGEGTWIGVGAIILGGADIGRGTVVGAGALVRKGTYPPNCLLAGCPAKVVRSLDIG